MAKKYHIFTLGCAQNHSDSQRVSSVFTKIGYEACEKEEDADVIVINSCAVKQSSMDRIYGRLRHWRPRQAKGELTTILTGCILQHDRDRLAKEFDHIVNLEDMGTIPEVLGVGEKLDLADYFAVPPDHSSEIKAFIPIMTGCDKFCTYCAVPYTRGREISRPAQDILDEVQGLLKKGYKEITLLGQNVNSYAGLYDKPQEKRGLAVINRKRKADGQEELDAITFPKLLELVAQLPGKFWVRYTSPHPYDMSDELIDVMAKYENICNGVNLPIQAGNNEVLKRMNRHYTIDEYFVLLEKIRAKMNPVYLSTDVIVGFCGETEEQFNDSVAAMERAKYDLAFISEYSTRPGTTSARKFQDDIPKEEKVRRKKKLDEVLNKTALENGQKFIDQAIEVLVEEVIDGKDGVKINRGRTYHGKPIQFDAVRDYYGQFVNVKVTEVAPFSFKGELV